MAKSTALATVNGAPPKGSELERLESDLAAGILSTMEEFVSIGDTLEKISKGPYSQAGYRSFNEYLTKRQPCGVSKSQGWDYIRVGRVRRNIPSMESGAPDSCWSIRALVPLSHKDFSPSDQRRIAKKVITRVKRGERLTSALVKQICDEDRGVPRKKKKKQAKALLEASLEANLPKVADMIVEFRVAFEMYEQDAWDEVEETNPQLIRRLITELDQLTSFLRGD